MWFLIPAVVIDIHIELACAIRAGEPQMPAALTSVEACFAINGFIIEVAQGFQSDAGYLIPDGAGQRLGQGFDHVIERRDLEPAVGAVFEFRVGLKQAVLVAGGDHLALDLAVDEEVIREQGGRYRSQIHACASQPAVPGKRLVQVDVERAIHITAVGRTAEHAVDAMHIVGDAQVGLFKVELLPPQLLDGECFRQIVVSVLHRQIEMHLSAHAAKLELQILQRVIVRGNVELSIELAAFQF